MIYHFRIRPYQQQQQQQQQQLNYHQQMILQQQQLQQQQQHLQHLQSRLSPNSNCSNQSSSSSSTQSSEFEDQSPKFNFRALLRKTGQDLTNGSTLSRKRNQIETRQVDFRNVLRNRTVTASSSTTAAASKQPTSEQVKLIQRLVTSH